MWLWLKAALERKHPLRRRRCASHFKTARGDAKHLVVEPGIDHRLAEAPLIADFDAWDVSFRDELEKCALIDAEVCGQFFKRQEPIVRRSDCFWKV